MFIFIEFYQQQKNIRFIGLYCSNHIVHDRRLLRVIWDVLHQFCFTDFEFEKLFINNRILIIFFHFWNYYMTLYYD